MASFVSSTTSPHTAPFCACGFGICVVKISRSSRNLGRAYYQCPRAVVSIHMHKSIYMF
ncbi:hypothetical protein ACSBR2_002352 [Camellia fascicularis]